jgi:hypothetical protein
LIRQTIFQELRGQRSNKQISTISHHFTFQRKQIFLPFPVFVSLSLWIFSFVLPGIFRKVNNNEGSKNSFGDPSHITHISSHGQIHILLQSNALCEHRLEVHADPEL